MQQVVGNNQEIYCRNFLAEYTVSADFKNDEIYSKTEII